MIARDGNHTCKSHSMNYTIHNGTNISHTSIIQLEKSQTH